MLKTTADCASIRLAIVASFLISMLAGSGCNRNSTSVAAPPATTQPAGDATIRARYAELVLQAEAYNAENPVMSKWLMNAEHCFVVGTADETLVDRVSEFVRADHALDLIFDRLLDSRPSDLEVLIDAQFLIYAGDYRKTYAEVIHGGRRARELLKAAEDGRFINAEKHYPAAPIRNKIESAARRVLAGGVQNGE